LVGKYAKSATVKTLSRLQTPSTTPVDGVDNGGAGGNYYLVNWAMPTMVATTSTATLDAVIHQSGSGGARMAKAALYTSGAVMVTGSQISSTSTTQTLAEVSFPTANLGSTPLKLQISNGGSATAYLSRAGLWITLVGVDSVSTYHRIAKNKLPVNYGTTYSENQRILLTHSGLTPHSFFHEECLFVTGGTISSSIFDAGNSISGASGSDVTSSTLNFSSPSLTCMRSPALSLGDNNYISHFSMGGTPVNASTASTHEFITTDYVIAP